MRAWWLLLVVGCAHDPVRPTPTDPYRRVERITRWYRPDARCANGPFDLLIDVPEVRWGAHVTVSAVATHDVPGHLDLLADGRNLPTWRWAPADVPDESCHGGTSVAVGPVVSAKPSRKKPTATPAPPPATPVSQSLAPLTARPRLPRDARTHEIGGTFLAARPELEGDVPDLASERCWHGTAYPKGPLTVRVWFAAVRDLRDVAFEVKIEEVVPNLPETQFFAQLKQKKEAACTHTGRILTHAPTAPPPPRAEARPPRPDARAEWIPGSWRWEESGYQWDGGFWRVPEVAAAPAAAPVLAVAPPAMPPPRAEAPPPAPRVGVVWVGGHWIWNGAAWAWTPGVWLAPPAPRARFVPPRLVVSPAGARLLPGGWIFRP